MTASGSRIGFSAIYSGEESNASASSGDGSL